jgi:hypothetical protein
LANAFSVPDRDRKRPEETRLTSLWEHIRVRFPVIELGLAQKRIFHREHWHQ